MIQFRPDIYTTDGDGVLDPSQFNFQGSVVMHLTCAQASNLIYFHTRQMTIDEDNLRVLDVDSNVLEHVNLSQNDVTEIWTIELAAPLDVGTEITVEVSYSGPITNDMSGMYYSYYEPEAGGAMQYVN